ncbi:MAG: hypothetical protein IKP88_03950 [Lachnospiraceae bacterium]|nr:hypothetical protein [Lachnospiraceae bacterium]
MKFKKYIAAPLCILAIALIFSACDKNKTNNTSGSGTTGTVAPTEGQDPGSNSNPDTGKDDSGKTSSDPTSDPAATSSPGTGDTKQDPDSDENPTEASEPTTAPTEPESDITPEPTSEEVSPTDSPSPTSDQSLRDSFNRKEYWQMSFLVWVPYFEQGVFSGQKSEGTYDFALFSEVSESDVAFYIESLKKSGYTTDISDKRSGGSIYFSAYNSNSWNVTIVFTDSSLEIGSGFSDKDSDGDETLNKLYSTTMLQYIPKFENGTFIGSETKNDSSMYTYALYSNVSSDTVSSYIGKLKDAGYIYAIDESYETGSTWFIALNEERFECHLEYDGSTLKIGCGISEDD